MFHLVHQGPQNLYFKNQLEMRFLVFFRVMPGHHIGPLGSSARLRFAGSSFLFENCSRPAGFGPKNRNFRSATWCGVCHLWINPTRKIPAKFLKMALSNRFPQQHSKKNPKFHDFSTLFSLWQFFARESKPKPTVTERLPSKVA